MRKKRIFLSPLWTRRFKAFKANRRAFYSLIIFLGVFVLSLFAEFIANDKPLIFKYNNN